MPPARWTAPWVASRERRGCQGPRWGRRGSGGGAKTVNGRQCPGWHGGRRSGALRQENGSRTIRRSSRWLAGLSWQALSLVWLWRVPSTGPQRPRRSCRQRHSPRCPLRRRRRCRQKILSRCSNRQRTGTNRAPRVQFVTRPRPNRVLVALGTPFCQSTSISKRVLRRAERVVTMLLVLVLTTSPVSPTYT